MKEMSELVKYFGFNCRLKVDFRSKSNIYKCSCTS